MTSDDLEPPGRDLPVVLDPDRNVSAETQQAIRDAVPANTQRGYAADLFSFRFWCAEQGRRPLPATPETAAEYVTFLKKLGPYRPAGEGSVTRLGRPSAPRSIERALSAIRTMHAIAGYDGQPGLRAARLMLNGYRKDRAARGLGDRRAAPLGVDHLRAMIAVLDPEKLTDARDAALLVLSFAMMNRRSETVALRRDETRPVPQGLQVLIPFSKTDQEGKGALIGVAYGKNPETCPVRLTRHWKALLERAHPLGTALFPAIDQKGNVAGTPGYKGRNTSGHLNGSAVTLIIRRTAQAAGLDQETVRSLSGHSIRSGGATAAYEANHDPMAISRRGRWKDGSAVLLGYIRDIDQWKHNPMDGVL